DDADVGRARRILTETFRPDVLWGQWPTLQGLKSWVEALDMPYLENGLVLVAECEQFQRLLVRGSQWFFDQRWNATAQNVRCDGVMLRCWDRNNDRVDVV